MKNLAAIAVLFCLIISVAGASSINGDYDGRPIVKVTSDGHVLQVEDVPAFNYNGRTVVPIYLLRQLGGTVDWNQETYSVNVSMPEAAESATDPVRQEQLLLKDAYGWLKDTDTAILMFAEQLKLYAGLENLGTYTFMLDEDYKKLSDKYNESLKMTLTIMPKLNNINGIREITASEAKALDQVKQTEGLLQSLAAGSNNADMAQSLHLSLLNSARVAQLNLDHTNDLIHQLLEAEMVPDLPLTPSNLSKSVN